MSGKDFFGRFLNSRTPESHRESSPAPASPGKGGGAPLGPPPRPAVPERSPASEPPRVPAEPGAPAAAPRTTPLVEWFSTGGEEDHRSRPAAPAAPAVPFATGPVVRERVETPILPPLSGDGHGEAPSTS